MDNAETLKRDIRLYAPLAMALEEVRKSLFSRVRIVANEEIAPELDKLLKSKLEGYHIYTPDTKVRCASRINEVPVDFEVDFRLRFRNDLIYEISGQDIISIIPVQQCLNPTLNRLAEEYGLSRILVTGEPPNLD